MRQKPAPVPATLVYVDAQLVTECEIADTREFYPFDAFVWEDPNSDALKKIAHCIGQGKFRGRKVRIVAHDIPDSPDPYKTKFGKSRAASVREYLVFHGVKRDAVIVQPGEEAPRSAYIPDGRRVDLELIGAGPPVGASQGAAPDPGPAI